MNITTELKKEAKDHWRLSINGMIVGVFERSQLRQLIQDIDNKID